MTHSWSRSRKLSMALRAIAGGMAATSCRIASFNCSIVPGRRARRPGIQGEWPTWPKVLFYVFISILYMFRGISCSSSGESCACRRPEHEKITDTEWHTPVVVLIDWFSWWWARGCTKHVENWNKYTEKNYASSYSFTINHHRMNFMFGFPCIIS